MEYFGEFTKRVKVIRLKNDSFNSPEGEDRIFIMKDYRKIPPRLFETLKRFSNTRCQLTKDDYEVLEVSSDKFRIWMEKDPKGVLRNQITTVSTRGSWGYSGVKLYVSHPELPEVSYKMVTSISYYDFTRLITTSYMNREGVFEGVFAFNGETFWDREIEEIKFLLKEATKLHKSKTITKFKPGHIYQTLNTRELILYLGEIDLKNCLKFPGFSGQSYLSNVIRFYYENDTSRIRLDEDRVPIIFKLYSGDAKKVVKNLKYLKSNGFIQFTEKVHSLLEKSKLDYNLLYWQVNTMKIKGVDLGRVVNNLEDPVVVKEELFKYLKHGNSSTADKVIGLANLDIPEERLFVKEALTKVFKEELLRLKNRIVLEKRDKLAQIKNILEIHENDFIRLRYIIGGTHWSGLLFSEEDLNNLIKEVYD